MPILITEVWEGDVIPIAVAGNLTAARARAEEHLRHRVGGLRPLKQGEWEDEEGNVWRWLAQDAVRHGVHVRLLQQDGIDHPHLRQEAFEEVAP